MITLCQVTLKTVVVNGREYAIRILDDDAGFGAVCDELQLIVWPTDNDGRRRSGGEAEEDLIKMIAEQQKG